jgi:hypothetical protein
MRRLNLFCLGLRLPVKVTSEPAKAARCDFTQRSHSLSVSFTLSREGG